MFGEHSQQMIIPTSVLDENVFVNYNAIFTFVDGLQNHHNYYLLYILYFIFYLMLQDDGVRCGVCVPRAGGCLHARPGRTVRRQLCRTPRL